MSLLERWYQVNATWMSLSIKDMHEVWDIFGQFWSLSTKWSLNLSDNKLHIDSKILSLSGENHFLLLHFWIDINSTFCRSKKPLQGHPTSWKKPWRHQLCGFIYITTSQTYHNVWDQRKYQCYIHIIHDEIKMYMFTNSYT